MLNNTLIMGLAAGLHYGDVKPFAESLDRSGYAGECVLFVTATTRGVDRMQRKGIRCVSFERPPDLKHLPYNAYRYFLYLGMLRAAPMTCSRVLVTDVRDVVFQSDPMSHPWPEGLNVTLEEGGRIVADCPWTARWVNGHLGGGALAEIADKPVSCSGTTVGDHASMEAYLERLCSMLLPFTPGDKMAGYDQGVHNHLLHTGGLDDLCPTVHDNSGPILTMGWKTEPPAMDSSGNILNNAGIPAVIVHQYDRMLDLHKIVRERYQDL